MFKKLFSFLIVLSMTLVLFTGLPISVSAEEVASGGCGSDGKTDNTSNVTWSLDTDSGVLTISGTGAMCSFSSSNIPWVNNKNDIKSVVIDDGVTLIGMCSFYSCENLTSITIPNSVNSIDNNAFRGCSSLASITIPNGVNSIGYEAFYNCTSLTSVTIPDGVDTIENFTFVNCSSLTSVNIPNGVTSIGSNAFLRCSSLTSITIPNGVNSLDNYPFANCNSLSQIIYKSGLTVSGAGIPATTTHIKYTVSNGMAAISEIEFGTNNNLAVIPETISGYSVAEITDKDLMKKIAHAHDYADGVCTKCGVADPNTGGDDNNNDDNNDNKNILLEKDGNTLTISGTGEIDQTDLTEVTDKDSITDVVIEDGITSVGDNAFDGFTNLDTVTIPDSVADIGTNAFDGTKLDIVYYESGAGVEESDFPAGVTQVEYSVNEDGNVIIESITSDVISEVGKVDIPNKIGGMDVAGVAEEVRDKVSVEGHTQHNYENGVCKVCGAADPNADGGSQGTNPSYPSYPSAPSRPTAPSTPVVTPNVTTKTETTAKADEEIIADDNYTGEDISSGAGDDSDDGGVDDMTIVVLVIAIAAAVSAAVLVKKIVF